MKLPKFSLLSFLLFLFILTFSLVSCRKSDSAGILSEGKMEDILYDYHLACGLAMQAEADSVDYYTRLYTEAVFAKYHTDAATFDRSMEWYARHTERLGEIYGRLADRMGAAPTGDKAVGSGQTGQKEQQGDTLMLWQAQPHILLHSQGNNRYVFSFKPDTLVHSGDRLQCRFRTAWHRRSGQPQGLVVLAIGYAGDSLAVTQQYMHSSGQQTFQISVESDRKVERIQGYVYLCAPWSDRPSLLTLSDFHLQCIHSAAKAAPDSTASKLQARPDSSLQLLPTPPGQRIRDSLLQSEKNERSRPHFQ